MADSNHRRWRWALLVLAICGVLLVIVGIPFADDALPGPAFTPALTQAREPSKEPECLLEGKLQIADPDGSFIRGPIDGVVYVKRLPRKLWPHPPVTKTVVLKDRRFNPPVVVLVQHDAIRFVNDDAVEHSIFSLDDLNGFALPRVTKGMTGTLPLEETGAVHVQCDIHADERADVLVLQNAIYSAVAADGSWRLPPLPPGDYEVGAWEPSGSVNETAKFHCDGRRRLDFSLEQNPGPQHRHMNGTPYTDQ